MFFLYFDRAIGFNYIPYQIGGEHRGRGYVGYSMSVNMAEAQANGELPASKAASALGVSTQAIKEVLSPSAWHHASSYYNKVNVYYINPYLALKEGKPIPEDYEEDADEIMANWEAMKSMPKPDKSVEQFYGDAKWLEWGGTRSHPKATEHKYENINIEKKGSFYTFYLPDGTTVRKKTDSNGTYVVSEEEKAERLERQRQQEEMRHWDNVRHEKLTEISKQYQKEYDAYKKENNLDNPGFAEFEKFQTETNRDGDNIYLQHQKPYSEHKDVGLRRVHLDWISSERKEVAQLQEWDGEKWNVIDTKEDFQNNRWGEPIKERYHFARENEHYQNIVNATDVETIQKAIENYEQSNGGEVRYQTVLAKKTDVTTETDPKKMRDAAKNYLRDVVRKQDITHPKLGKIRVSNVGIKEFLHYTGNLDKLALVPHLKELIETSEVGEKEDLKHPRKDNIVAFYPLYNDAYIDGKPYDITTKIGVDNKGNLFYTVLMDDKNSLQEGESETKSGAIEEAININITPSGRDVNSPRYQTEEYDEQLEADLAEFDKILDSFAEENKEYYSKKGKFEDAKKIQKKYKDFFMYNIADASVSTALHDPFYFEYDGQKDITNIWIPKKLEKNSNIILYRYAEQISIPVNKFEKSKFKKLGFKRQKLYDEGMRDIYTLNKEEKSDDARDFVRENGKYIRKPSAYYQTAYAGSRVDYDKPSLEAIGTGEGAQVHGWGLYYALSRDVAEKYRETFDLDNYFFDEEALENERAKAEKEAGKTKDYSKVELLEDLLVQHDESTLSNYSEDLVDWYNKNIRNKVLNKDYKKSQVHEVDIPENPYLLDEQKTFEEQSDFVKDAIRKLNNEDVNDILDNETTGEDIYGELVNYFSKKVEADDLQSRTNQGQKMASQALEKVGIKGITYDGEQDGRCFVIFNPKDVKVIQKFYQIQEYEDLRSTKSVSDVKKLLRGLSPDEEVRLMFDKNKGYWFAIDAQNYVHQDMITKAFEQGLYPEFRNSYEAQQYFDENYNADDEYLVRFKAHNFIDENDLQKLLDENIPYDEYKYGYAVKNNDGSGYVLFARSLYDLADTPLKSIGRDAEIWERNPYNMTEFSKVSGQELERNGIRYMAESGGRKPLKPYKRHPLKVMGQYEPTKKMITLFKGRNPTTLVHEMGHHYLPIHLRLLEKAGKWDKLKPLYKELGISSVENMGRDAEEKLIDMFTSYIYYNEAPNVYFIKVIENKNRSLRERFFVKYNMYF